MNLVAALLHKSKFMEPYYFRILDLLRNQVKLIFTMKVTLSTFVNNPCIKLDSKCFCCREDRVKHSIGHMLGQVVDGAISTLLGIVMLAGAEFDFIIT